ncbi:MAG TPA: hypothetical protein VGR97_10320 [Candidatus Acidoferrales bacterium]|nr:hypothetical protein [Candidatus Acidoferrales bacterium]
MTVRGTKRDSSIACPGASGKSKGARLKSKAAATKATTKARDTPLGMTLLEKRGKKDEIAAGS